MAVQNLFSEQAGELKKANAPLAEKMRPGMLDEFVGQEHLVGENKPIRLMVKNDDVFSHILWGPPGTGKTTLAKIIANTTKSHFESFSGARDGLPRFRQVTETAKEKRTYEKKRTILFVDEIHRLNKGQQDAFLPFVEEGDITLIGATTENPSFEVNSALLSRMQVFVLYSLDAVNLQVILKRAEDILDVEFEETAEIFLLEFCQGDARVLLNSLEFVAKALKKKKIALDDVTKTMHKKALRYDKSGEEHYNIISALHKSMRDSDADASLYWLCRMLEAGEDPLYVARRMIRFATEDIGNADPQALQLAIAAKDTYHFLGSPEGELALAQCAVYLARAPKSNEIYTGYKKAQQLIKETGTLPVPLHLRNAPTKLMKELGYAQGYKYAHDYAEAKVNQSHFPDEIDGVKLL